MRAFFGAIHFLYSFIARLIFALFLSLAAELKNSSVPHIFSLPALVVSSESTPLETADWVESADLPVEHDLYRQTTLLNSLRSSGASAFFCLRSRLSRALRPPRRVRRFIRRLF